MSEHFLTPMELHDRLVQHNHFPCPERAAEVPLTDVWPSPDLIISVAVDPDATLRLDYRERYFVYVQDEADSTRAPVLALTAPFATLSEQLPETSNFVAGPVRWLLVRLGRFTRVLFWPDSEYCDPHSNGLVRSYLLEAMPCLRQWLNHFVPSSSVGAIILDLADQRDCQVLWEAALLVGRSNENFFVSDEHANEVYLLHHHDKIVVSIPNQHARWLCLEELADLPTLFEDWSGYYSPIDEE